MEIRDLATSGRKEVTSVRYKGESGGRFPIDIPIEVTLVNGTTHAIDGPYPTTDKVVRAWGTRKDRNDLTRAYFRRDDDPEHHASLSGFFVVPKAVFGE